ncbi:MAG: S9 family peptidase [Thermaerobacter sp.]|nr:S9 family peptidase [Thermaerobacter sp.]
MSSSRNLVLHDYYRLQIPTQPVLSPDGRFAAVGVISFLEKDNERLQSLFLVPVDGGPVHRLTRGKAGGSAPAFSPDGRQLAFLSTRPDEPEVAALRDAAKQDGEKEKAADKDKQQVWVLDLAFGGEPRQLTYACDGVESFCWSPDGKEIAYAARAPRPGEQEYLKAIREDDGPFVLRRVQHKQDGVGYLDEVTSQIFLTSVETRTVRQLTSAPFSCRLPAFSPDGATIAFFANCTGEPDQNHRQDIFCIDRESGQAYRLTRGDVNAAVLEEPPAFSPDGTMVAFASPAEPENEYLVTRLLVAKIADARPLEGLASALEQGFSSIGGVVPDGIPEDPAQHGRVYPVPLERTPSTVVTERLDRPVRGGVRWLDDQTLVALIGDQAQTKVARVSLAGEVSYLSPCGPMGTVAEMDAQAGRIVATLSLPDGGHELYRIDPDGDVRLTAFQEEIVKDLALPLMERLTVTAPDGASVDAIALFPPGHLAGTPEPLIVQIHGGPMAYDSPRFDFENVYFAQRGYVVLQVNYRGSISFGEAFCKQIRGCWGPLEHMDVMAGVDHLLSRGDVDPERLYVTGFSQGGIMTNWAVGHTDRFRAAVSEHGMWEYSSSFGTDDCQLWWQDDLGVPWQNPEGYRKMSPASGAASIHTPLLITAGQEDWRCPLDQAEQLYITLRKRGVPTELVIYQGEHHSITKPRRAIDRLRRIGEWFARYGGPPLEDDSAEGYPGPQGPERGT